MLRSVRRQADLITALLFAVASVTMVAAGPPLVNGWEVHRPLEIPAAAAALVPRYFPSFEAYQDLVLYHPRFGYYASGRVSFTEDFQTFPTVLAPYFGSMLAEQVFRMWAGMRAAGTLDSADAFTIAELGGGNGVLAESLLEYVTRQAAGADDRRWRDFAAQLTYASYDRSSSLLDAQRTRNARFRQFEARAGDATTLDALVAPASLKGVLLSNELLDVFAVHKVIVTPDAEPRVAFVVPSMTTRNWRRVEPHLPAESRTRIAEDDRAIARDVFAGRSQSSVHLSRRAFVTLLESLPPAAYDTAVRALEFREVYLPVTAVPALADHFRRFGADYAAALAAARKGAVIYVNLGAERFIDGAARVLRAGYVVTIDYGITWSDLLSAQRPHLRVYGPDHRSGPDLQSLAPDLPHFEHWQGRPNPYAAPTFNDVTTDVNFSVLAASGRLSGLLPVYVGTQRALQQGTGISLETPPPGPRFVGPRRTIFASWVRDFLTNDTFKLLIQQKAGTDPAYFYPANR